MNDLQINLPPRPKMAGALPWDFLVEFRNLNTKQVLDPHWNHDKPEFFGTWPNISEIVAINAWRHPRRLCFSSFESIKISLSYEEVRDRIRELASWFRSMGLGPMDRVALCGKNSIDWALCFLAILEADGVVVPIDGSLKEVEIKNLLRAAGAKFYCADTDKLWGKEPNLISLSLDDHGPGSLTQIQGAGPWKRPQRRGKDLAAILFTSGTTGDPKGVMLSFDNLVSDIYLAQYFMPLYPTDVFYALLPLHHSYSMLAVFLESLSVGAETVFAQKIVMAQVIRELAEAKVTMFLGVPLLFNKLMQGIHKGIENKGPLVKGLIAVLMGLSGIIKATTGIKIGKIFFKSILKQIGLERVRICISGGGPLAAETFKGFNRFGLDFVQGYGLTETSPIITLNPIWKFKVDSVGAILPGTQMRISNPDSQGNGEILVRGPMCMLGYWNKPEETKACLDEEGWIHTGDLGFIDKDNYVYLTGRAKNLIVTEGGKNVYPEEIENAFQLYPEIEQIMVRGSLVDDKLKVEQIEACIFPSKEFFRKERGGDSLDIVTRRLEEIVNSVNKNLHTYQRIQKLSILSLPLEMTSTKKIKRHLT